MTVRRFRRQKEQERKKAERVAAKAGRKSLNTFIVSAALLAGTATAYGAPLNNFNAGGWVPGTTVTTVSTTGGGVDGVINGNTFAINAGDSTKSILNWNQLNVPTTKTLSFDGQNTLYLNKVTGGSASTFAGTLTGNSSATVIVVNPNGVTINSGAVLNPGNLMLSTAPATSALFTATNAGPLSTDLSAYSANGGQSPITISGGAVTVGGQLLLQGSTIDGAQGVLTANQLIIDANGSADVSNTANSIATLGNVVTRGGSFSLGNSTSLAQTGAISTGTGSITINAGTNNIILDQTNSVGGLITLTGGDIVLNNSNAAETKFGEVVAANLSVDSGGKKISQNGTTSMSVSGTTYLNAGSNVISLTSSDNEFVGSVNMTGGSVTLTNEIATQLGTVSATSLNVTSGGAISQEAGTILDINGSTTLAAGDNDVNIGNNNNLVGPVSIIGKATTVGNDTATVLGDFDVTALSVTSAGPISQALGTSLDVDGPASFNAGGSSVNLMSLNNEIVGPLSVTGGDVDIYNNGPTALGNVTAATFDLTSIGAVTQDPAAAMIVSGETEIEADGFAISLAGVNQFGGPLTLTGSDVTVNNTIATQLGDVLATGSFTLTSGGDVTQVANSSLEVTGDTTINAGPTNNIILDQAGNRLVDEVSLTGSVVTLNNSVATTFGDVTAGTLDVISDGAIRQDSGTSITVAGETHLDAGDDSILLRGDNAFAGPITLTGGDVTINNTIATQFGNVTAENLDVASGGAITQTLTSVIHVDGTTTLDSGSAPITLRGDNEFEGTINLSGGAISLNNLDDTIFGDVDAASLDITSGGDVSQVAGTYMEVAGTTIIDAGSNDITLNEANEFGTAGNASDYIALAGANIVLNNTIGTRLGNIDAETLTVRSGGDVTQRSGSEIDVAGTVTVDAGTNDITLSQQNDFNGVLTLTGGDVTVANSKQTILGDVIAENFDVTSAGAVSQSAGTKLVVADDTTIQATAANVTLNNDNQLGGLVSLTGGNVSLKNTLATELGDTAISGNFTLTSGGAITQEDGTVISVAKVTTIDAGSNSIDLGGDNKFTGRLNLTGGAVDVNNTLTTVLGDVDADSLDIDSGGAITQAASTKVEVTGASSFNANDGASNIVLSNDNQLGGPIALTGAAVTLNNEQATILGNVTANNLDVTSEGAISQNSGSAITVAGTASFTAGEPGARADITLDQDNEFTGAVSLTGANVALTNDIATVLGAVDAASLTVNSEGAITQAAGTAIDVAGAASFTAGTATDPADITLDGDNDFYGPLAFYGHDVVVNNSEPTQLADVTAEDFSLTSDGSVTQVSGAKMTVEEKTVIDAGSGDITLLGANQLNGEVTLTGAAVQLNNTVATLFGNVSADSLAVTSGGDITQSSGTAISVTGDTSLNAGTNKINLEEANTFGGQLALVGGDVDINNTTDTILGNVSATTFDLTSDGSVTQASGTTVTSGDIEIDTSSADGDVKLTNADNTFGIINVSAGSGNVAITETGSPMTVDSIVTSGDISLKAIGASMSVTGAIGTDDQASISLTATGDTSDVSLGADSIIEGRNITVTSGRDIYALGSVDGNSIDGLITLKANGNNGVIYGSNDDSKTLEAHAISLIGHTIGTAGATVETDLDTDNIDDTFGLKLRLGKIDSTSGVNVNNTGDATLSFRASEELEPEKDANNLTIEFLRNPLITKDTNYTIGNSLTLTPGNLSDPNIQSVTLASLADRVLTLEDALGDGFDANHTVAGYISRIINGTDGVFGLDGNTTSSLIASEYYANPGSMNLLALNTGLADEVARATQAESDITTRIDDMENYIALENTDELGQISDIYSRIDAETARATDAETNLAVALSDVAGGLASESARAQAAEQSIAANVDLKTAALQAQLGNGFDGVTTTVTGVTNSLQAQIGSGFSADNTIASAIAANTSAITANTSGISANAGALAQEVLDRQAGDAGLQAQIGSGFSADNTVASAIAANTSAITANTSAISANAGALAQEVLDRQAGDTGLQAQIGSGFSADNTVASAISANTSAISANAGALAQEVVDRKAGDAGLQTQIGTGFSADNTIASAISTVAGDLLAEQIRATGVEGGLQSQIDNEVSRATGAEKQIASNLADESTRAQAAETLLQGNIDTVALNLTAEAKARADADTALQGNIDTVASDLLAEQSRATDIEGGLQGQIDNEVSRATLAENQIATNLADESTRAQGVETSLQGQIGTGFDAQHTVAGYVARIINGTDGVNGLDGNSTSAVTAQNFYDNPFTNLNRLQAEADTVSTALNDEIGRAKGIEDGLQTGINTVASDLLTEVGRATTAEADELARATAAEGVLQDQIGTGFDAQHTVAGYVARIVNGAEGLLGLDGNTNSTLAAADYYATPAQSLTALTAADTQLQTNINNVDIRVTQEIGERTSADQTLQGNINSEQTARIAADGGLQASINQNSSDIGTLQSDVTGLRTDVNANIASIDGLRTDVNTNSGDISSMKTDIGSLQSDVGGLQSDVGGLRTDVNANIASIDGLRTDVNTNSGDISSMKTDIGSLQSDVGGLRTDVNANIASIDGLRTDVNTNSGDISSMKTDIGTLQSDVTGLRTDVDTNSLDITGLKGDVGNLQAALGSGFSAENTVSSAIGGLRTDVDGLRTDVDGLRTDVNGLRTDVNANSASITDLNGSIASLQLEDTNLQGQIDGTGLDITDLKGRVSTVENDLGRLAEFSGTDPVLKDNVKVGSYTVGSMSAELDTVSLNLDKLADFTGSEPALRENVTIGASGDTTIRDLDAIFNGQNATLAKADITGTLTAKNVDVTNNLSAGSISSGSASLSDIESRLSNIEGSVNNMTDSIGFKGFFTGLFRFFTGN